MKKKLLCIVFLLAPLISFSEVTPKILQEGLPPLTRIEVDCTQTVRTFAVNPTGFCLSFLNDADSKDKAPLAPVIKSMNIGSLRFPEGALAEHYLFHDLRKGPPVEGRLQPRAIIKTNIAGKGRWVKPDGHFTSDTLDFDHYIMLCRQSGTEPVVTVSAQGHKFKGTDIDEEALLRNAEEWVRYANVTHKWGVKYWEIGNEVDHKESQEVIQREPYMDIYKKMATRMKAVDPTIKTGLGTGHGPEYTREALKRFPELVDFAVVHKYAAEITTYDQYLNSRIKYFSGAAATLKAIDTTAPEARRQQTELLITEFSSFSWVKLPPLPAARTENSIMNAMLTFEMLAEGAALDNRVRFLHFWITHNPWKKEGDTGYTNALGPKNEILPQGRAVELMGRFVRDRMVSVKLPPGPVRCWASSDRKNELTTVWLVNRDRQAQEVTLSFIGNKGSNTYATWSMAGTHPDDTKPSSGGGKSVDFTLGTALLTLAPLSITILYNGAQERAKADNMSPSSSVVK